MFKLLVDIYKEKKKKKKGNLNSLCLNFDKQLSHRWIELKF
jgi:hypothetical protein